MKFVSIVVSFWVAGAAFGINAHRPAGIDYRLLVEKHRQSFPVDVFQSAYDAASGDFTALDVAKAPESSDVTKLFAFVRDRRVLSDAYHGSFLRRLSWLYPHEGCWVRATLAAEWADHEKLTRPAKLFMFGNLEAKTPNSSTGKVTWWYHVAPIVRDGEGKLWVIDPAVNPAKPLSVEEELSAISYSAKVVKVAICSSSTYEPFDDCGGANVENPEAKAMNEIGQYLYLEWINLLELGRLPEKELGDEPPWR